MTGLCRKKKWVDKNRNCILAVSMSVNEPVSSSCLQGVHMVNGLVNKKIKKNNFEQFCEMNVLSYQTHVYVLHTFK